MAHHVCRRDAGQRAPAGVHALGPGAVFQEHLHARGRAGGDALRIDQLLRIEPEQLARHDGGAEVGQQARRMEARMVEAAVDRLPEPDAGFHAGHVGRDEFAPACADRFADCERRRQAGHRGMHDAGRVRVVEVQPVHEEAVGHGRVARGQPARAADDGAVAYATGRGNACQAGRRERELVRGEGQADAGDDVVNRLGPHGLWQGVLGQVGGEGGQRRRDIALGNAEGRSCFHACWKLRSLACLSACQAYIGMSMSSSGACCCAPYTSVSPTAPDGIRRGRVAFQASAGGYSVNNTASVVTPYRPAISAGVITPEARTRSNSAGSSNMMSRVMWNGPAFLLLQALAISLRRVIRLLARLRTRSGTC
eukprot:Opistho-2@96541